MAYHGEEMPLSEAMRRSGTTLSRRAIRDRLRMGWTLERALTAPSARIPGKWSGMRPARNWDVL